jgi:FtsP/CotA-like multicopper oxidase with cupredoxin domain
MMHCFGAIVLLAIAGSLLSVASETARPEFANPPILRSHNGSLHVDLVAAPASYSIGGRRFDGMLYNGQYVPAVWRLRAGDKLTVSLQNRLNEATNLHFHGMGVSPLKNADNVFLHIEPQQTFTYEIRVPDKHIGLFWFHPHMHGDVDQQIIGGMSGGIIIDGNERLYPYIKNLRERIILIKHHPIGRADYDELVTVNGQVAPNIPIRPGEAQFWHIGNIGADRFLRLKIEGIPFYLIGRDGYFVPKPIRMEEVILGPGQRFSAIVVGGEAGSYAFKSTEFKFDENQPSLPEVSLGTVVSRGPTADVAAAAAKVSSQRVNQPLYVDTVRSSTIARRRTFTFSRRRR